MMDTPSSSSSRRRPSILLLLAACLCLGAPRGSLARSHHGTPHHLNANGEERLIGWKGETHSVAGSQRQATTAGFGITWTIPGVISWWS
jgi:hypothetical protein